MRSDHKRTGRRRLRLRFSMLTILGAISLFAVGLGMWQATLEPIRRQWLVVEPLLEAGITVESRPTLPRWMRRFLPEGKDGDITAVHFNRRKASMDDVRALTRLPYLERLYMERTGVNDELIEDIAEIQSLRRLSLWGCPITDVGGSRLAHLPNLELVDLQQTRISWRTVLAFQDRSEAEVRGWYGNVHVRDIADISDLARLNRPATFVWLEDADDNGLSQCVTELKAVRHITARGRRMRVSEKGLRTVYRASHLRSLAIQGYFVANKLEMVRDVCRIWGPQTSELVVEQHDARYFTLRWLPESANGQRVQFDMYVEHLEQDNISPQVFSGFEHLDRVQKVRFDGWVNAAAIHIINAMPGLKHVTLVRQSPPLPAPYVRLIPSLEGLETFQFSARLAWQPVGIPSNFFENWKSRDTLREVSIHDGGIVREQLLPLLACPRLKTLKVSKRLGGQYRDVLQELRAHHGKPATASD